MNPADLTVLPFNLPFNGTTTSYKQVLPGDGGYFITSDTGLLGGYEAVCFAMVALYSGKVFSILRGVNCSIICIERKSGTRSVQPRLSWAASDGCQGQCLNKRGLQGTANSECRQRAVIIRRCGRYGRVGVSHPAR